MSTVGDLSEEELSEEDQDEDGDNTCDKGRSSQKHSNTRQGYAFVDNAGEEDDEADVDEVCTCTCLLSKPASAELCPLLSSCRTYYSIHL